MFPLEGWNIPTEYRSQEVSSQVFLLSITHGKRTFKIGSISVMISLAKDGRIYLNCHINIPIRIVKKVYNLLLLSTYICWGCNLRGRLTKAKDCPAFNRYCYYILGKEVDNYNTNFHYISCVFTTNSLNITFLTISLICVSSLKSFEQLQVG